MAHRLNESLVPVSGLVGAADVVVGDGDGSAAIESGVPIDRPLLQGHGQCKDFGGGAGLVGVINRLVAPLPELELPKLIRIRLGAGLAGGGGILLLRLRQLRLKRLVVDGVVVHQIVGGAGGNRQQSPGVHVHDDAGGPVLGPEAGHHILQALLHPILDVPVDGELQTVTVLGVVVLLILEHELPAVGVLGCDHQACVPLQLLVVDGLQAVGPLVVAVEKAQHVGRDGAVGVVALGVHLEVDPPDALAGGVVGDEGPDLIPHLLLYPLFQNFILALGLAHPGADCLLVHLQNPGELRSDEVLVRLPRHGQDLPLLKSLHHLLRPLPLQLPGPGLNGVGV